MRNIFLLAFSVFAPCCYASSADPVHANAKQNATLTLNVNSDSTGTVSRNWWIKRYTDTTCTTKEKGKRLLFKVFAKLRDSYGPITIEPNEIATLAFIYIESRTLQNRECSHTVNFLPKPGESYIFNFSVSEQSMHCELNVQDSTGASVPFTTPEYSCFIGTVGRIKNGQPGVLNYNMKIVR